MRTFPSVCASALLLMWSGANAQSDAQSERLDSSPSKDVGTRAIGQHDMDLREQMEAWYKDCSSSWDAGTQMSKKEFDAACERSARERVEFLDEDEKNLERPK